MSECDCDSATQAGSGDVVSSYGYVSCRRRLGVPEPSSLSLLSSGNASEFARLELITLKPSPTVQSISIYSDLFVDSDTFCFLAYRPKCQ